MNKSGLAISLMVLMVCSIVIVIVPQKSNAQSGTQVGGILWDNTTWTKAGNPYLLTSTIQIPSNSTLTIEPGVTVSFANNGIRDMFSINGAIIAHGTPMEKISFNGVAASTIFFWSSSDKVLDISYCSFQSGSMLLLQNSNNTHVIIRNCEIKNVQSCSQLGNVGEFTENYIESNAFINSAGFKLSNSFSAAKYLIQYNLVKGNTEPFVESSAYYNSPQVIVNYNSFIDCTAKLLRDIGNNGSINAQNNYWGTANTATINALIDDRNDNMNNPSFVNYLPILTEPDKNTPTYVAATATSGGTITPSGTSGIKVGSNQAFTITPNSGYHVADVLVNGTSVGAVTTYSMQNIQGATTISVAFASDSTPTPTLTQSSTTEPSPSPTVPEFPAIMALTMLILLSMLALIVTRVKPDSKQ